MFVNAPSQTAPEMRGAPTSRAACYSQRTKLRTTLVSCTRCGLHSVSAQNADLSNNTTGHFARSSRHRVRHRRAGIESIPLDRIDNNVLRGALQRAGETDHIRKA